jgi:hypothetical protein
MVGVVEVFPVFDELLPQATTDKAAMAITPVALTRTPNPALNLPPPAVDLPIIRCLRWCAP